jgi:hypothetical protein
MANSGNSSAEQKASAELEDHKPAKSGGCGVWGFVIVILIVLVAAAGAYKHFEKKRAVEEAQRKQARALTYKSEQSNAANDVGMAMSQANRGDIQGALTSLERAQSKYKTVASGATQQKDEEAVAEALGKASAVGAAIDALKAKQDELVSLAKEQIGTLAGATKLPASSEPGATGSEPTATGSEPPAAPEQPGATPDAAAAPAHPADAAPATPPAGGAVPAPSGG